MTMPMSARRKGWSRKQKRLALIAGLAVVLAIATALVLTALRDQIVFFYSPSDVVERSVPAGHAIRLGGLVKDGSWTRSGQENTFTISDGSGEIVARYTGILPDLFREGQASCRGRHERGWQLHRQQRPGQARRELHSQGSGRGAEGPRRMAAGGRRVSIELGHFSLILAFAIAVGSALGGLLLWRRGERLAQVLGQAAILQMVLVAMAFLAVVQAFAVSDFSLALAANHSHSLKPLIFKISGVWGNHEGSMLLWVLILVIFGGMVALFGRDLPTDLRNLVLGTQSLLTAAFTGFTLFTSNPFERLAVPPLEGNDLNPVLQDIGLAIHPPLLYAGYVGFSICFSFAVAALVSGRIDQAWARWVRPWTMLSWTFLTLGIAMAPTGPITSSAGAAGGSGTRWRMPASCPGSPARRCCIRRW